MTACNAMQDIRRPTSVTCACGTVVAVKPRGRLPWQCPPCANTRRLAQLRGEVAPLQPPQFHFGTPEALGPEQPELGMSEVEYARWKTKRAVQLYQEEPELSVQVIAERLGLSVNYVHTLLNRAGLHCRGDGRAQLASGPPL